MDKTKIPAPFERAWCAFDDRQYLVEAGAFQSPTAMEVDVSRPPFLCAGNLQDHETTKIVSFGLAPHSRQEYIPNLLRDYYGWRLRYFDTNKVPHRLHSYIARLCRGVTDDLSRAETDARWLWRNGYLTMDLVRYYIRDWIPIDWKDETVFTVVKNHFSDCLDLLKDHETRLAVFTGKSWEELLVTNDPSTRLTPFTTKGTFRLSDVTGKPGHRANVYVGEVTFYNRPVPALIIGHLIHQIWGLSYVNTVDLGRHIRRVFVQNSIDL